MLCQHRLTALVARLYCCLPAGGGGLTPLVSTLCLPDTLDCRFAEPSPHLSAAWRTTLLAACELPLHSLTSLFTARWARTDLGLG